jgi:hypothetical protein
LYFSGSDLGVYGACTVTRKLSVSLLLRFRAPLHIGNVDCSVL